MKFAIRYKDKKLKSAIGKIKDYSIRHKIDLTWFLKKPQKQNTDLKTILQNGLTFLSVIDLMYWKLFYDYPKEIPLPHVYFSSFFPKI
jgi:hypothetical protein